jgi:hypothetical protein
VITTDGFAPRYGRGARPGAPFRIGPDADRASAIGKSERWLADRRPLLRALDALRERDLPCFWDPAALRGLKVGEHAALRCRTMRSTW